MFSARSTLRVLGLLTVASTALLAQTTPQTYVPRRLSAAEVTADIALLRRALEEVHAGYNRYVPRPLLDTAFARLGRRAASPMTELQFYRETALLLAKIRCNHTKAEYPAALSEYRKSAATHLPVRVRVFGDRLFAATPVAGSVPKGAEIVSINGVSAKEVIDRLSPYAAVDGFTDFVRPALLARDPDLMGSDLDQYWPVEFGFTASWTLVVRTAAGQARTATIAPITYAAWTSLDGDTTQVDFANGTRWSKLDDTSAVLTIRSFVNYRAPVDVDSVYRTIFGAIQRANVRHLILDLRGNGGGSDDASSALLRFLADAPVQPLRVVRRRTISIDSSLASAFDTWGDRAAIFTPAESLFTRRADGWFAERGADAVLQPSADTYRGRVSVLVGRQNGSATTMLLAVLQEIGARTGRLRLVGEETGGSAEGPTAGQILFLQLPGSGIRVRIPLKRSDVNTASLIPGMGLFPDVDGTESLADFRAGIDRALVTARTTPWTAGGSVLAPTTGLMKGVLEYRDYGSGERVLLTTWQHLSPIGTTGAYRQRTVYDDGPGKTIYSTDVLRVSGARWIEGAGGVETPSTDAMSVLRIVSRRTVPGGQRLVLTGGGTDDNKPVEFRYTLTVGAKVSTRLKEFRTPGGTWNYRHEYRFARPVR